jgi:allantoinase
MYLPDVLVRSRRVVTRDGVTPAAIHIRGGRIIGVLDFDNIPENCPIDDAGDLVVMPGLVDTNVHVNASTSSDSQAFEQTTRAAAAGGVTTIIDMGPAGRPIASVAMLEQRRRAADGHCAVDVGFCGGIASGKFSDIAPLAQAGVFGFTCAFGASAIDDGGCVDESDLRTVMPALTRAGALLTARVALRSLRSRRPLRLFPRGQRKYTAFLEDHPKDAETNAIVRVLELCREYGTRTHLLSLSSSDALTPIFQARAARLPVTVETCPHYLFFASEEIPDGATSFKCVPPIRDRANRELLRGALSGGLIQTIASAHSAPPAGFRGAASRDFSRAWSGIASLQLSLPAVWTIASARELDFSQLAAWMCRNPARIAGLEKKGEIDVGYDADLVVWNPDAEFTVDPAMPTDAGSATPYAGRSLRGIADRVYLRGNLIYERRRPIERTVGRLLVKPGVPIARVS